MITRVIETFAICRLYHIGRATIPSSFLRFVLMLHYYVLENINVLISKKCPYLRLTSLFLIFCSSVAIFN